MMALIADPELDERLFLDEAPQPPAVWQTVVWNDPVNLMSYVSRVFRTYFGYDRARANTLMLMVHEQGHAVVADPVHLLEDRVPEDQVQQRPLQVLRP